MKYCYTCKRYRPDKSAFCTQCGSSFDLKLCPRLHPNSIRAEYCQICGSSDLSTPHKRPRLTKLWLIALILLALLVSGLALVFVIASVMARGAIPLDRVITAVIMTAALFVLTTR